MLEGIEVLNQTEIMTECIWAGITSIVFLLLCIISVIIAFVCANIHKDIVSGIFAVLALISIVFSLVFMFITIFNEQPTGKYEYEVTIDDSVSMVEFYERYEVIEVSGKIYTIRER